METSLVFDYMCYSIMFYNLYIRKSQPTPERDWLPHVYIAPTIFYIQDTATENSLFAVTHLKWKNETKPNWKNRFCARALCAPQEWKANFPLKWFSLCRASDVISGSSNPNAARSPSAPPVPMPGATVRASAAVWGRLLSLSRPCGFHPQGLLIPVRTESQTALTSIGLPACLHKPFRVSFPTKV